MRCAGAGAQRVLPLEGGAGQRAPARGRAVGGTDLSVRRADFVAACPLDLSPEVHPDGDHASLDPKWTRLVRRLPGRGMADAEAIGQAFEDAAGSLPAWLLPADAAETAALLGVVAPWLAWYRAEVSPLAGGDDYQRVGWRPA